MRDLAKTSTQILEAFDSPTRDLLERSFKMVDINRMSEIESGLWIRTEFSEAQVIEVGTRHVIIYENHETSLMQFTEVDSAFMTMGDLIFPLCFETFKIG